MNRIWIRIFLSVSVVSVFSSLHFETGAAVLNSEISSKRLFSQDRTEMFVYAGTYTSESSEGIYVFRFHLDSGTFSRPRLAAKSTNPSFLSLHPTRSFLYAVNEISGFEGDSTGAVSAFQIDPKSGDLIFLNRVPSGGKGPCFVTIDSRGQFALVANYGGGSVSSIEIQSDGYLGKTISNLHHHGSSIHPRRQTRPHAHSILLDPLEQFAFAADLGTDQVWIYLFERNIGSLRPHVPPHLQLPPGSGPRHLAFHPALPIIYVINELTSRVAVIRHHQYQEFHQLQLIPTLPDEVKSSNYPAEILVHPSGQFLYASNRGHDSIAGFRINPQNGKLTPVSLTFSGGNVPRNFNFDPTGKYLLVANQRSSNIVLFEIDRRSGKLRNTNRSIKVPEPVCIRFWPASDTR